MRRKSQSAAISGAAWSHIVQATIGSCDAKQSEPLMPICIAVVRDPDARTARTARASLLLRWIALACATALMLAGCTQPWQQFETGQDQSTIIARLGPPA